MGLLMIMALSAVFAIAGCPDYLLGGGNAIVRALTYHFFHANIFHLLANCLSIWLLFRGGRSRLACLKELAAAYCIASLTYFAALRPVAGVSNMIFAVAGLRTSALGKTWFKRPETRVFLFVSAVMMFFPQLSAITHLLSFFSGAVLAAVMRAIKSVEHDRRHASI